MLLIQDLEGLLQYHVFHMLISDNNIMLINLSVFNLYFKILLIKFPVEHYNLLYGSTFCLLNFLEYAFAVKTLK